MNVLVFLTCLLVLGVECTKKEMLEKIVADHEWPEFDPAKNRPLPSFILSNWNDSVISWNGIAFPCFPLQLLSFSMTFVFLYLPKN